MAVARLYDRSISQGSWECEAHRAPIRLLVVTGMLDYLGFEQDLIGSSHQVEVVGRTAESVLALELLSKLKPEMALVDIGNCVSDGLKLIRNLRVGFPKVRIAVLSNAGRTAVHAFCLRSEKCGFVRKSNFREDLDRFLTWHFSTHSNQPTTAKVPPPVYFSFSTSPFAQIQKEKP